MGSVKRANGTISNSCRCSIVRVVVTGGAVSVVPVEMFVVGVGMISRVIVMSAVGRGIGTSSGGLNRSDRGTVSIAEFERGSLNFLCGGNCTPGAGVPFGISGVR